MVIECPSESEPKTAYEYFRKHVSPPKKVVESETDSLTTEEEQQFVE